MTAKSRSRQIAMPGPLRREDRLLPEKEARVVRREIETGKLDRPEELRHVGVFHEAVPRDDAEDPVSEARRPRAARCAGRAGCSCRQRRSGRRPAGGAPCCASGCGAASGARPRTSVTCRPPCPARAGSFRGRRRLRKRSIGSISSRRRSSRISPAAAPRRHQGEDAAAPRRAGTSRRAGPSRCSRRRTRGPEPRNAAASPAAAGDRPLPELARDDRHQDRRDRHRRRHRDAVGRGEVRSRTGTRATSAIVATMSAQFTEGM